MFSFSSAFFIAFRMSSNPIMLPAVPLNLSMTLVSQRSSRLPDKLRTRTELSFTFFVELDDATIPTTHMIPIKHARMLNKIIPTMVANTVLKKLFMFGILFIYVANIKKKGINTKDLSFFLVFLSHV